MEFDRKKRTDHVEMISDRELWSVIRYLDPESDRCLSDLAVIVLSLLAFASIVCILWLMLHLRGL